MTDRKPIRFSRRSVLGATGGLALGVSLPANAAADSSADLVLEQGDHCVPVTPLTGTESAEELYDWRQAETDYSSAGTTDLQRDDTSILFVYRDPQGEEYLVIVHDRYDTDESGSQYDGGSVTFEIGGLSGGSWVVQDDNYPAPTNYDNWAVEQEPQRIDWTWDDSRTDGGVYGPLPDDLDIYIEPRFNEDAALSGQYYDGRIVDWQVLTGERSNPTRTSLSMGDRIRIRRGQCSDTGRLDVRIPLGRVNPRSQGRLAVDLHSTRSRPINRIRAISVRTTASVVRPVKIRAKPDRKDVVRLFFPTAQLDLSGTDTATIELEATTLGGKYGTGEATVRLTPNLNRNQDRREGAPEETDDEDDDDDSQEYERAERDDDDNENDDDDVEDDDQEYEREDRDDDDDVEDEDEEANEDEEDDKEEYEREERQDDDDDEDDEEYEREEREDDEDDDDEGTKVKPADPRDGGKKKEPDSGNGDPGRGGKNR
jgi:hypothetical protein